MHILFINGGNKKFSNDFREACRNQNATCITMRTVHTAFHVTGGRVMVYTNNETIPVDQCDYAFMRVRGKSPYTASILLKLLNSYGIPTNDPVLKEHTNADEKLVQMVLLTRAGVPVPETWLCTQRAFRKNREAISEKLTFPCVVKTNGSQGRAVWKIDSLDELEKKIQLFNNELFIIQEYVPNSFDIRVLCAFGDCLGAIARAATDGFYNNVSHGGTAKVIEITGQERALALQACKAVGVDFGGVDIVRTPNGPMLFEVNCGPQVYGFEGATSINVPDEIVQRILTRTKNQS